MQAMGLTGAGVAAGGEGGGLVGGLNLLGGVGVGGHLLLLICLGGLHCILVILHDLDL